MSGPRRTFTAAQRADVVRRHLKDKVPVSQLAEELNVQPGQIHLWVQTLLSQAERAFQKPSKTSKRSAVKLEQKKDGKIQQLEEKLTLKNEVISELMEENVKPKSNVGSSERALGSP